MPPPGTEHRESVIVRLWIDSVVPVWRRFVDWPYLRAMWLCRSVAIRPVRRIGSHVFLVGFSGVGKSTIGRAIASYLGAPFVDLDESVDARVGLPGDQFIQRHGQLAYRRIERACLPRVDDRPAVVATGSGTATNPLSSMLLMRLGTMLWLDAPFHTCAARIEIERSLGTRPRPWNSQSGNLAGDYAQRRQLWIDERRFYGLADWRVPAIEAIGIVIPSALKALGIKVNNPGLESASTPAAE